MRVCAALTTLHRACVPSAGPLLRSLQVTVPSCHGMNSSWPRSRDSLTVSFPDATARISAKISRPTYSTVAVASTMRPQLMSMSSAWRA